MPGGPVEVIEAIGAVQAQNAAAPAVGVWARTGRVPDLMPALQDGRLLRGTLLRGTLHLVSARQYPAYAAVVEASGLLAQVRFDALRVALLDHAAKPRSHAELVDFIEGWVATNQSAIDPAELARQRQYNWRPLLRWHALVRPPGAARPTDQVAAPVPPERWPDADSALRDVAAYHLRAFGPAGADDVAQWIGWKTPPVRAALEAMDLARFEDERGRRLYDHPDAPRPDPDTPAPPRLLPWFDNVVLAYAPAHRARILPDEYRDRVYVRANLQWLPLVLLDGMVAGTWAPKTGLQLFVKPSKGDAATLERLLAECPA
ncbi:MAG TPA: winged helix DNA-binding domain-containing protein [Candidatus Dormibacteraeota bacterium]